jgi:hypothetical protein
MSNEDLTFNKDNLTLLVKARKAALEKAKSDKTTAVNQLGAVLNGVEATMLNAWLQPIMLSLKNEEDAKTFAKLIVSIFILNKDIDQMAIELSAIEMLLDKDSLLSLASVSFEEMEVLPDAKPTG